MWWMYYIDDGSGDTWSVLIISCGRGREGWTKCIILGEAVKRTILKISSLVLHNSLKTIYSLVPNHGTLEWYKTHALTIN